MMSSLPYQQNYDHNSSTIINNDYNMLNHHPLDSHDFLPVQQRQYNDQDQFPSFEKFDAIVQDYLLNLSSKKRDKALIDQARYGMILQVLQDPRNTTVSTAQFRFWVKKMFQLSPRQIVCHDGKPVAMREEIYGILVRAHREAHHGGRDKTSALVRRRYSWIPKELIARFVRHCPFCISRRNGSQQSPLSLGIFLPATPPTYSMVSRNTSVDQNNNNTSRAPSMIASSSTSSNASSPEEIMMMAAAAAAHQQNPTPSFELSWQQQQQQQQPYYQENQESNNNSYYESYNLKQSYPIEEQAVYYNDFGLKQNVACNSQSTFRQHNLMYDNTSPSLSPSSSSISATSSPVNPAYHENNILSDNQQQNFIQPQCQQTTNQYQSSSEPTNALSLLSHHQSLY